LAVGASRATTGAADTPSWSSASTALTAAGPPAAPTAQAGREKAPELAPGLPMKPVPPAPPGLTPRPIPPAPPSASAGQENATSPPTRSRTVPNPRGADPAPAPGLRKSENECATSALSLSVPTRQCVSKIDKGGTAVHSIVAAITRGIVAAVFMRCGAEATDRSGRNQRRISSARSRLCP
jgi:hypothetical protein